MQRTFKLVTFITTVVSICMMSRPVQAQTLYGSLIGNVTDPSGAAVPSVKVVAVNTATNFTREQTTDERGGYLFADLQPGTYNVTLTAPAFATFTKTGLQVSANAVIRADIQLQLASSTQTVTIAASAATLQTDRAEVRSEMSTRQYRDLPIGGARNYTALFKLVPGFTPPKLQHSIVSNPQESLVVNVNGSDDQLNSTRIDGASNVHAWLPRLQAYSPPIEMIESVNIVTNSMDAEQGLTGGAAVTVMTKSGTNDFHGVGFEYHTNSSLKAKNVFDLQAKKPKYIQNQYGGTFGGPIVKNKLFFFLSEELTSRRWNYSRYVTIPTAEQRAGDFSKYGTIIYDPLTGNPDGSGRKPFPENRLPQERLSRVAQQMNAWLPPAPTNSSLSANYFASGSSTFDRNSSDAKINWNKSEKFTMWGRLSVLNFTDWAPTPFDQASGEAIDTSQQAGNGEGRIISSTIGMTYIVSPAFLVDASVGYVRMAPSTYPIQFGKNIGLDVLKLPGTNGPDKFYSGIPEFQVSGYETTGNPGSATPYFWHDNQYQYNANATWTKGAHNIRFGLDVSRQHMNHMTAEQGGGPRGSFQFTGGVTALKGGASPDQLNAFAAYMLGLPSTISKTVATVLPTTTRAWAQGYYVRDQWQASRNLTVTMGLRYEYYPMITRADRGIERYDVKTNKMLVGGVGSVPMDAGVSVSHRLFSPRVGLAYRIGDKWVIRSGYGININPFSLARPLRTNYPILVALDVAAPNSYQYAGITENGIPPVPVPSLGNGIIDVPGKVNAIALDDEFKRGYIHTYNFTVQRELKWGFVAQAGYVGSHGVRPLLAMELNYAEPGAGNAGRVLAKQFGRTASTTVQRPFGSTDYNSVQASVTRRFANYFQLQSSYTFSKSMAYRTDWNLPSMLERNRTLADYDRPHNFQAGFTAETPFGRGKAWVKDGFAARILGGWQLNGIFSRYSGLPFTVTSSGASLNAPGNLQTADQVKPEVAILGGTGRGQSYFDPLAFRPVLDQRFGNSGVNRLRGPGVTNLDLGLFREFAATEKFRIQFRAEGFNATNTPHFNNPGTNASNMRLNANGTVADLRGFSEITSAQKDERQFRLGLRLSF